MDSEENNPNNNKKRRYKKILDPNCQVKTDVTERTYKAWNNAAKKILEKIKAEENLQTFVNDVPLEKDADSEENDFLFLREYMEDFEDEISSDEEAAPEDKETVHSIEEVESEMAPNESASTNTPMFEKGEEIMFSKSKISVNDVMQMIVAFSVRFGSTDEQRNSLLEMFKICAGPEFSNIKLSNYQISKVCNPPEDKITYHFYCDECSQKRDVLKSCIKSQIKNTKIICPSCNKEHIIGLSNPNIFLSIDLEYQLRVLLQYDEVADIFLNQMKNKSSKSADNTIRDIHDGALYNQLFIEEGNIVTYVMSTDGAPLFNMSKRAFWPFQIILNFLPPRLRFKYVLLIGIMIVRKEPKPDLMNLFVNAIKDQIRHLYNQGLKIKLPNHDEIIVKFVPICVVADSVARPILQNRIQYNGYCGCSYCYHNGKHIHNEVTRGIKYPFLEEEATIRTHASHLKDLTDVSNMISRNVKKQVASTNVRGVKGISAFLSEPIIDMVWGFPLDYVHNGVIGVTEQIWVEFYKQLSTQQRAEVDKLLLQIQPPRDLYRCPEKISNKAIWKATNWKSFLLYYSLPILSIFLKEAVVEHFALFVNSIYTLLKLQITEEELNQCERDLMIFVAKYQHFYGVEKMTFNIHILLHAVSSVRMTGPLWATSAFPFEHNIFILKNLVNGTKSIEQQMAIKSLKRLSYQLAPTNPNLSRDATDFCKNLFSKKMNTKSSAKFENVTFFGPSLKNKFQIEQEFQRCIQDNVIFASTSYVKSNKFNDTVVQLKNKTFVQIIKIVLIPNVEYKLYVKKIIVRPFIVGKTQVSHIWKIVTCVDHPPISLSQVESKVVALNFEKHEKYLCVLCNNIEAQ